MLPTINTAHAVQGFSTDRGRDLRAFRADRVRQEPGLCQRGDQAELHQRGGRGCWVANLSDAADATQRTFLEILKTNEVPFELNKSENVVMMKDTGSRILFRSMEDYERLRGRISRGFGVDELTYTHGEAWTR